MREFVLTVIYNSHYLYSAIFYTSSEIPIAFFKIRPLSLDAPKGSTINCKSGIADLFACKGL